ncbi:MAG TPA: putative glycolipid-binding domain-containing protein [Xanthobacteraceae bacterium]|jgi:hypothetical protein
MGAFRPLEARSVRWRPLQGVGLEYLTLAPENGAIVARAVTIGTFEGKPFGARYKVVCDANWTFRELKLDAVNGVTLCLSSDGHGHWTDAHGQQLSGFETCIDIDLGGSPFTNTLPIRRLDLDQGDGPMELSMLYVPFDTFEPFVDGQRYSCLQSRRRYRYEAVDGAFVGELVVDEDGLVLDFPPLFTRVRGSAE